MKETKIEVSYKRVANFLKKAVNGACSPGNEQFDDIGDMPNTFDLAFAIKKLDAMESEHFTFVNDEPRVIDFIEKVKRREG